MNPEKVFYKIKLSNPDYFTSVKSCYKKKNKYRCSILFFFSTRESYLNKVINIEKLFHKIGIEARIEKEFHPRFNDKLWLIERKVIFSLTEKKPH